MDWKQILKDLREKRAALMTRIDQATTTQELDSIEVDLRKNDIKIKEAEDKVAEIEAQEGAGNQEPQVQEPEGRKATVQPSGGFNPVAVYGMCNEPQTRDTSQVEDVYSTIEYRQAFKEFVVNGTPIPDKFIQKRANSLTTVADIGAVIPTNIMDKVVEEAKATGMILPRVFQTNFQAGIEIPISEIKPVATWVADENTTSDEQKVNMDKKISFSYHLLECKVALGLLSATVSLPVFEATIVKSIKQAMIIALETAIIKGSGTGQPLGVISENVKDDKIIKLDQASIKTVEGWASVEAAMPLAYEANGIYLMAKSTWEKYINGATDKNGQRIGFTAYGDKLKRMLNGREVELVDYLPGFDLAKNDDVFAVLVDLNEYLLNSNLAMTYKKYYDDDKNKWVHKSLLIADGKMCDKNGLILVKKTPVKTP